MNNWCCYVRFIRSDRNNYYGYGFILSIGNGSNLVSLIEREVFFLIEEREEIGILVYK